MFYIIAGFSIHIKKPVFEADAMDARKYIDFLRKKQTSGRLKEGVCACIYSQLCRFYEYACAMGYMEESPFSGFSSIFQFPGSLSSATLPSLLQNKAGRSYAVRSLQNALARQQADSGINICYAELWSLSRYLMLVEKIPAIDIAAYAGVTDRWLTLYDHIPDELVLDAAKYMHLRVAP